MEDMEKEICIQKYPKIIRIDYQEKIIEQMKTNYMNSLLQCLFNILDLRKYFIKGLNIINLTKKQLQFVIIFQK